MISSAKKDETNNDLNKIIDLMYTIYYDSGAEIFMNFDKKTITGF